MTPGTRDPPPLKRIPFLWEFVPCGACDGTGRFVWRLPKEESRT